MAKVEVSPSCSLQGLISLVVDAKREPMVGRSSSI